MANALEQPEVDAGNETVSEEVRRATEMLRTDKERQKQSLNLQKENILSQKTWHPARRAALVAALTQIEAQIEALN